MKLTVEENRERIKRYGHIKPAPTWGVVRCSARCPGTTRTCTLERGHRGLHVAHGMFNKVVAVWDAGVKGGQSASPKSVEKTRRAVEGAPREALRKKGPVAPSRGFWSRITQRAPSMEGALLFILGLGMLWFAIDTALHILGWR